MNPLESLVSSMTLAELSAKTGTPIEAIVAFASTRPAPKKSNPAPATKAPAPKVPSSKPVAKGVNTRTPEGRYAYDAAVLGWLKSNSSKNNPQPSSAVIQACSGTGLQARTALNRLIGAGKVSFAGKARATKYWAS